MKNGRKTVIGICGLLAGAALLLALLYALPVHTRMAGTMYDDAGIPSDIQMDLTVYHSVFSPSRPKILGTVVFEGRQYQSAPYFEKQRAYYFIDAGLLDEGGTAVDLTQNALYFPYIDLHFLSPGSSDLTGSDLLMLQTRDGEGKIWRSTIQDP